MLYVSVVFLLLAIIAFVLGFGGFLLAAASVGKALFYLFITLFVVSGLAGLIRIRPRA